MPCIAIIAALPASAPQIFGKTLVCRSLDVAARVAKETDLNCVTMEGDQVRCIHCTAHIVPSHCPGVAAPSQRSLSRPRRPSLQPAAANHHRLLLLLQVERRGTFRGGYYDASRSKIQAMKEIKVGYGCGCGCGRGRGAGVVVQACGAAFEWWAVVQHRCCHLCELSADPLFPAPPSPSPHPTPLLQQGHRPQPVV